MLFSEGHAGSGLVVNSGMIEVVKRSLTNCCLHDNFGQVMPLK